MKSVSGESGCHAPLVRRLDSTRLEPQQTLTVGQLAGLCNERKHLTLTVVTTTQPDVPCRAELEPWSSSWTKKLKWNEKRFGGKNANVKQKQQQQQSSQKYEWRKDLYRQNSGHKTKLEKKEIKKEKKTKTTQEARYKTSKEQSVTRKQCKRTKLDCGSLAAIWQVYRV